MANIPLLFLTLFAIFSNTVLLSEAAKALVLPVRQDAATKLLVANIKGRTPLVQMYYVVDTTAEHLWANCETNYKSSTFSEPKCGSVQCKAANTSFCHTCGSGARSFCHANTCGRLLENPVSHQSTVGEVAQDVFAFSSTDGSNPGHRVKIPDFLFTCSPSALVEKGLPKGVQGVAGLAQGPIPLQNQLAAKLGIKPIFATCIPSTTSVEGVIFFGSEGPYTFIPGIDASTNLVYTPLSASPFGEHSINIKSIKIGQKSIPIPIPELEGTGGTIINTLLPYTVLEGSIFKAVVSAYAKEVAKQLPAGVGPVKPIAPFGLCYDSKNFVGNRLGYAVPSIDLELDGASWSFLSPNVVVDAKQGVLCLAFVNGRSEYRAQINIGTHQMRDTIWQFDVAKSRLGLGFPLAGLRTHCENFNFTTVAETHSAE